MHYVVLLFTLSLVTILAARLVHNFFASRGHFLLESSIALLPPTDAD
jgi:hypothetical protein